MQKDNQIIPKLTEADESIKTVTFLIKGEHFLIGGNWQWDMQTETVFCSDVMMGWPQDFIGTKGIIHPDDVEKLLEMRVDFSSTSSFPLAFRIITTYGDIQWLHGTNLLWKQPEIVYSISTTSILSQAQAQAQLLQEAAQLTAQKMAADCAEKITHTGTWYSNTVNNQTWYSDEVYRIYGLPVQSLNAHPNSFHPFLHPHERLEVIEAIEKAFVARTPLHLEFRILSPSGKEAWVYQTTSWSFNASGELIVFGVIQDITQQKLSEQARSQDETMINFQRQLLHFAETSINTGYWQNSIITKKIVYSDNHYRIFGLKPQSVFAGSATFLNYIHPDDRDMYEEIQRKMRKEHVMPDIEYRIIRPDGKIRFIRQKGKTTIADDEVVIIGTIQDITVQKILEKKFAVQHQKLLVKNFTVFTLEQTTNIGSWVWNTETMDMEWSDNFYELIGLKPNAIKLTLKLLLRYIHPDDQKMFTQQQLVTLQNHTECTFAFRIIRKGEVKQMKAKFQWMQNDGDGLFVGLIQDITAEYAYTERMAERLRFTDLLADTIPNLVMITDTDNNILLWNKQCEEIYHLKRDKVIGKNFFDVFPELKQTPLASRFSKVLLGENMKFMQYKGEHRLRGYFNVVHSPLKYPSGEITGILHLIQNITTEHLLHKELSSRLQFIEKLLEISLDKIVVLDKNMNYLYWNKRAEEEYGLSKEQVIGKNILEVFPKSENHPLYGQFRQALRGQTVHLPAILNDENGKINYTETYLIPVTNEKKDVEAVLWVMHDLSREVILSKEQKKAKDILDTIHESCLELNSKDEVVYLNRKAALFFKCNKEEILKKNLWQLFPELVDTPIYFAILYAQEEKKLVQKELFFPISNHWINVTITPSDKGVIVLFFDVHLIKTAREKLKEEHRRLKEAQAIGHIGNFEWIFGQEQTYWSDELYRINGMEPQAKNITLSMVEQFIHPEDKPSVNQLKERSLANAGSYQLTHRIINAQNKIRVVNHRFESVADENGQIIKVHGTLQDITEQQTAQDELRKSKELLQSVFDVSINGITFLKTVRDVQGEVIDFICVIGNQSLASVCSHDREPKNISYRNLIPGVDSTELLTQFKNVIEHNTRADFEICHYIDAKDQWCHVTAVKLDDGLVVTMENNTSKRKAAHQQMLQAFFDNQAAQIAHIGNWQWNITRDSIYWSENLYRLFNLEPFSCQPDVHKFLDVIHPNDKEKMKSAAKQLPHSEDGKINPPDFRIINADGSIKYLQSSAAIITKDGERVVVGTVKDNTESERAKEELKQQSYYAEIILNASIDQITVFDTEERFIAWNKRCEVVTGLKKQKVLGKKIVDIFPKVANDQEFIEAHQKALAGEYVHIDAKQAIYEKSYHEWFYIPLKNDFGKTYAVINIVHDISQRVMAESKLMMMNIELEQNMKELAQKNEEITNFAFIANHDLKEPLRKIYTFGSWLVEKESENLSLKGKEYAHKLIAAVGRLDMLIEDITALTQITSSAENLAPVDLNHLFMEVHDELAELTDINKAVVESSTLPVINGHYKQLVHLFKNFITNALKFQYPGLIAIVEIKHVYKEENGAKFLVISFRDNGIGFDPVYTDRIFKVFQRLHTQSQYPGTGIGLAICKKIMDNHGGFISVDSTPGKGSIFYCYFPTAN